ncbi:MAG: hypothetical protein HKO76_04605 [Acidimicrobiia bacterium]|nr:hypothetical protein [Acidimicrobiia bacterium]
MELLGLIFEKSVIAGILGIVLWLFLPRLIKAIDSMAARNAAEHQAIMLMLNHLETRMNWHEAKVYGVNPSVGADTDEQQRAAVDAFMAAADGLTEVKEEIRRYFDATMVRGGAGV